MSPVPTTLSVARNLSSQLSTLDEPRGLVAPELIGRDRIVDS